MSEPKAKKAEETVKHAENKHFIIAGIPAFNEDKTIASVVLKAQKYADKIVVCDDGSTDLTREIAERLGADVVTHEHNMGYGAAIQSLFKRAKELNADVLVTLDGDGQHDPAEISNLVKPILDGVADVVVGSRFVDERLARAMPWYRRAGVKFITRLANGNSGLGSITDAQSGFRAYSHKSLAKLAMFEDGMGVTTEILINARKQGLRICEVTSSCSYDTKMKTSTHHPVRHGLNVVASIVKLIVEDKPLILLGLPGSIFLILGTFFGVWMLQAYAVEHRIITNIALASIAFIMLGFFCLSTAITLYAISRITKKTSSR